MSIPGKCLCRIAVVAALALLAGCASHTFEKSIKSVADANLKGSRVEVYMLLDFRESSYGPDTLALFETRLGSRLAAANVATEMTAFRDTSVGHYFSITDTNAIVPVERVVRSNAARMKAFGAQYSLFILPTMTSGDSNHFTVTWVLGDNSHNAKVWEGVSQINTDYIWSTDYRSDTYADFLLDPFMAELKKQKLID